MMSIRERAEAVRLQAQVNRLCKIGQYRLGLPDDERDALDYILKTVSTREARKILAEFVEVGTTLIAEHKRGDCACR